MMAMTTEFDERERGTTVPGSSLSVSQVHGWLALTR